MADKKDGKSLRGKSRREALEFIKKSPEKFDENFSAFYELETQLVEISKSLVKYLKQFCNLEGCHLHKYDPELRHSVLGMIFASYP